MRLFSTNSVSSRHLTSEQLLIMPLAGISQTSTLRHLGSAIAQNQMEVGFLALRAFVDRAAKSDHPLLAIYLAALE